MKKSDYRGWWSVFCFSFRQGLKQKAYVLYLLLMGLCLLLGPIFLTMIKSGQSSKESEVLEGALYVFDDAGLEIDYASAFAEWPELQIKVQVCSDMSYEAYQEKLVETEDTAELGVHITYEESGYYRLGFVRSSSSAWTKNECERIGEDFAAFFKKAKQQALKVSEEQMAFISRPVEYHLLYTDADGALQEEKKTEGISMEEYFVLLGGIMVCMIIITLNGSSVANAIVTEKSTRVIEYLMINVKPMALIIGKVLACICLTMLQLGVMGLSYGTSVLLQRILFGEAQTAAIMEKMEVLQALKGISTGNVLICILILLMGILFFSFLAGVAGASVSKLEELAEGMKVYQIVLVVGAYIGIGVCVLELIGGIKPLIINICGLLPITAPFIVPAMLLTGRMTAGVAVAAFVLLTVCTLLLYLFTARVYESMIFYNGKVLKLRDILEISGIRSQKGGRAHE